jgi:hypothetical protein
MTSKTRKAETLSGIGKQESGAGLPSAEVPAFEESITRLMGWPIDTWLRCQASLLEAATPATTGWVERRREAAHAALDTFERLSKCNDLQQAASIHREWLEGTMRRLDSDLHALADHAVAVSHEAMAVTRIAAQSSSDMAGLATQNSIRALEPVEQAA